MRLGILFHACRVVSSFQFLAIIGLRAQPLAGCHLEATLQSQWPHMVFTIWLFMPPHTMGSPGGSVIKNQPVMQETRVQSLGREDPLEKEMATHSNILAERIPWTEEPDGLQSQGSHLDITYPLNNMIVYQKPAWGKVESAEIEEPITFAMCFWLEVSHKSHLPSGRGSYWESPSVVSEV